MLPYFTKTFLVFALLCSFLLGQEVQTKEASEKSDSSFTVVKIDELIVPESRQGLPWQLPIDMGVLNADEEYKYLFSFECSSDFAFDGFRPSCRCYDFSVSKKSFESGESGTATLEFKASTSDFDGKSAITVTFHRNGNEVGMLVLNYSIAGSLYLERSRTFDVTEKNSEYRLPLTFTFPISENSLSVTGEDSFKGATVNLSLAKSDGFHFVKIRVESEIEGGFTSGQIHLEDSITGSKVSSHIALAKLEPVVVSPKQLSFSKEDGQKRLAAKAIVKIEKLRGVPRKKMAASPFNLSIGNLRVAHKATYLGKGIFRVAISLDPEKTPSDAKKILWTYSDGESNGRFTTSYSLE